MLKVSLVSYSLDYNNPRRRAEMLETELNNIERNGGTVLHITSDSGGYTIVYRQNKMLNG